MEVHHGRSGVVLSLAGGAWLILRPGLGTIHLFGRGDGVAAGELVEIAARHGWARLEADGDAAFRAAFARAVALRVPPLELDGGRPGTHRPGESLRAAPPLDTAVWLESLLGERAPAPMPEEVV